MDCPINQTVNRSLHWRLPVWGWCFWGTCDEPSAARSLRIYVLRSSAVEGTQSPPVNAWEENVVALGVKRRRRRKNTWRRSPAGRRPWSWEVEQQLVDGFRSTLNHYLNLSHMFNSDESIGDSKFELLWLNRPVRFLQEAKAFNSTLTKVCGEA